MPRGPGVQVGKLVAGCEDEAREENDGNCEVINEQGALDQLDVKKGPGRDCNKRLHQPVQNIRLCKGQKKLR